MDFLKMCRTLLRNLMADRCELDMDEIVQEKMKRNNIKYPVEKAKDSAKKYNEL